MDHSFDKSRRKFIINTAGAAAFAAAGPMLQSFAASKNLAPNNFPVTSLDQAPLPYAYDALENVIDAKTMELHYAKHGAAYAKALKEAVQAETPATGNVEALLPRISKYSKKMRDNAGGHYNHEMFWKSMRAKRDNNMPSDNLETAINNAFGSFDNFKAQFSDAAKNRFGSGWAWLYKTRDGALKIGSTPNQDNPLMDVSEIKGFPLLGLDVWEHAYYLKYQNKRPDYIENWWKVVNWDYVSIRMA